MLISTINFYRFFAIILAFLTSVFSSLNPCLEPEINTAKPYVKLQEVAMPEGMDGKTLSESEMLDAYRGHTDWRISEIRTTEDTIQPAEGGTAYYVSSINGKSTNNGRSPEKPLSTLKDVNKLKLKAGDVVYFERGSIFRGQLLAKVEGVTYAAYGTGNKPAFYASPYDGAKTGKWLETDVENVYVYSLDFDKKDIGAIVFDGGKQVGIKCLVSTKADGSTYNKTTGEPFESYRDLQHNLHFYHDYKVDCGFDTLYLYCEDGNPADVFDSIEFSVQQNIIFAEADNVTFDNLCLKYGGARGIGSGTRNVLTVTNCEIGWIGGSIQPDLVDIRYGNGVEIYGGCDDYTVNNCYFYQIYDAAVTFQHQKTDNLKMLNIDFCNNVIEYCNYSVEYFLASTNAEESYIENVKISGNLMWYAGYGLCEQRPDYFQESHIRGAEHINPTHGSFEISNNLFVISKNRLLQSNTTVSKPIYNGNTYIQFINGNLGRSGEIQNDVTFDSDVKTDIENMLGDENATVVFLNEP